MATVITFVFCFFVAISANPISNLETLTKSDKLHQNGTNYHINRLRQHGRNADLRSGSGFTDVTDFSNIPYTAAIYSPAKDFLAGLGVIINNRWLLTSAYTADTYSIDTGFIYYVYQSIADPISLLTTTVRNQKIEGTIIHPNYQYSNFIYNLALTKVCPPFVTDNYAIIPPPSSVNYNPVSTVVTIYIYFQGTGKLSTTTNVIAADTICSDDMSTYDATKHFCSEGSTQEYAVNWSDELATAIYLDVDGRVIGIGADEGKDNFSISSAVKLENFYDWITTNTAY